MIDSSVIRKAEWLTLALGAVVLLFSTLSRDLSIIGGVCLGVATGWLNLASVRWLLLRAFAGPKKGAALMMVLFGLKFGLLIGLITFLVLVVGVNALGFLGGYCLMVVAISVVPIISGAKAFDQEDPATVQAEDGERSEEDRTAVDS